MSESRDCKPFLVAPDSPLLEAIRVINETGAGIAMVVDADGRLAGTLTDGDVRRGLLRKVSLQQPVSDLMCRTPVTAGTNSEPREILEMMQEHRVSQIPIVDESRRVRSLKLLRDFVEMDGHRRENPVVIMAGGLGSRLHPLTESLPKPLLPVGERPILETMIQELRVHGFCSIFLSLGYRGEDIEKHFSNGHHLGVQIHYLRETVPLGTAGAIRLARSCLAAPFLVVNADLLTKVNFGHMLDYHLQSNADMTVGLWRYEHSVPFGVVDMQGTYIKAVREKPELDFYVNAGVYVMNPCIVDQIEDSERLEMPALINRAADNGCRICAFPIWEYWLDVGRLADMERANADYHNHFKN